MRRRRPDFLLHSGDAVYADEPLTGTVTLPDGRVRRNLVTEEKSKVAETLREHRGQYAYNLLDDAYRRFVAEVPQINQWDDHEVADNWYPGEILDDPRYTEKRVDVLAARAHADPARGLLGAAQRAWLINGLRESRATWKVIANDTPLGLVVPDRPAAQEGVAQRDPGAQGPRARVRSGASVGPPARRDRHRVPDRRRALHRRAPLRPARAAVQDFTPFWEFVSGPAHAGAFGPFPLDRTFGPRAVFQHAPPAPFTSPAVGFQHFGEVEIDAETREFKVSLRDRDGVNLWSVTLPP